MALRQAAGLTLVLAASAQAQPAPGPLAPNQLPQAAADAHDASAEFAVGNAFDLGQLVPADPAAACMWYMRAGDDGSAAGEFNAGVMHDAGRCGPRDAAAAARWYGRAAARGHARAQYALAQLYRAGDGVPANLREARAWFAEAAQNGIAAAAVAVQRQRRRGELTSAAPVYPLAPVRIGADAEKVEVPLVWTCAEQPGAARFIVEVDDLAASPPAIAVSIVAPRTAALATLPPGSYAWRVITADPAAGRYVASVWSNFEVIR